MKMPKKLTFIPTPLPGAYLIEPLPFLDQRGFFTRVFCATEFREAGLDINIVQINHSGCGQRGMIRGMHYQIPPAAEVKMVKCIRGKVYDVIIDVRRNSLTFLHWYGVELSAENQNMLYVPPGFAHGFQALADNSEMIYLVTASYSPEHERGVRYNDPQIGIEWKLSVITTSEKDAQLPLLNRAFEGIKL